jgi:hypothetical protein
LIVTTENKERSGAATTQPNFWALPVFDKSKLQQFEANKLLFAGTETGNPVANTCGLFPKSHGSK